jgi:hypothetical protein
MTKGEFFQTAKEPREKVKDPYPNLVTASTAWLNQKPMTYSHTANAVFYPEELE